MADGKSAVRKTSTSSRKESVTASGKSSPNLSTKHKSKMRTTITECECPTCLNTVSESQSSMQCDMCQSFTHLRCDEKMPKAIYDILNQYSDNPLIYLCVKCQPKHSNILAHAKLESIEDQIKKLSSEKKVIIDNLSVCDRKIDDITSRLSEQNSKLSLELNQRFTANNGKIDDLFDKISSQVSDITKEIKSLLSAADVKSDSLAEQFNTLDSTVKSLDAKFHDVNPTLGTKTWADIAGGPKALSQETKITTDHRSQDIYSCSLVVYQIPKMIEDLYVAHQLASVACINKRDIVRVSRLGANHQTCPPLMIQCSTREIRWALIKSINQRKTHGSYARPHLNPDELKKDRELVRKLADSRRLNPGKILKIYRGRIIEVFAEYYLEFEDSSYNNDVSTDAETEAEVEQSEAEVNQSDKVAVDATKLN